MRIFITGISGTIGTPLHAALLAQGHEVYGCDLFHSSDPAIVRADVAEFRQIETALRRVHPEFVFHLAAEFGRVNGEEFYDQVWRTNAIGTKNMLVLQKQMGFRMVHASTSEVYGDSHECGGPTMLEEFTAQNAVFPTNDYAISKLANELQIHNAWKEWQSPTMVLRFCNTYGPGEFYSPFRSVVCIFCYSAVVGKPWTVYPSYYRAFLYMDDFIETLAGTVQRFHRERIINIGGTEYVSLQDLSDRVVRLSGCSPGLANVKSTDGINAKSKRLDVGLSERLLAHRPVTSLDDGIQKTLAWMRYALHNEIPVAAV
jgi:dTDP-glucose 4,6-dehydratase